MASCTPRALAEWLYDHAKLGDTMASRLLKKKAEQERRILKREVKRRARLEQ